MDNVSFFVTLSLAISFLFYGLCGSYLWFSGKEKLWNKVRVFFIGWSVLSAIGLIVVGIIDGNNLKKAVKETKSLETYIIENSVPLYLQSKIEDECKDFYNHFDIEISEDGTYATLVPRNKPER